MQVTGVMTQGRSDGKEWVTSYVVSYSLDAYTWKYAADFNGNRKVRIVAAAVDVANYMPRFYVIIRVFDRQLRY